MLGALEGRFASAPVVVLGVHSGKFLAESDPDRVRQAVSRYGVNHPVVVDADHRIWQSYTVRAWPTLVIIRPDGTVAATLAGEPDPDSLHELVSTLLSEARRGGTLGERISPKARPAASASPLAYPGKVVPTPWGLAISDSGNHRVLLVDGKGRTTRVLGSGEEGLEDGPADGARFRRPQGLALSASHLYVADSGNHALRSVSLDDWRVETVAGDGTLGRAFPSAPAPALKTQLRSPWDLAILDGVLLVAMAGFHQIWAYLPEAGEVAVLAGTGRESIDDGVLHEATFSQPAGLATHGRRVYVADSESSAVREIDLDRATVRTIVGCGLFVFGDRDGPRERARLQHVEDVAFGPNGLLVADAYNDKIKRIDPDTGAVETWFAGDGRLSLSEPGGLVQLALGQVIVADTNHHRIVVIDGETRKAKALVIGLDGKDAS